MPQRTVFSRLHSPTSCDFCNVFIRSRVGPSTASSGLTLSATKYPFPLSATILLLQFGVTKIFNRDADLSGVSSDEGLFVQEMVQHVAVRVDNTEASTSVITCKFFQPDNSFTFSIYSVVL